MKRFLIILLLLVGMISSAQQRQVIHHNSIKIFELNNKTKQFDILVGKERGNWTFTFDESARTFISENNVMKTRNVVNEMEFLYTYKTKKKESIHLFKGILTKGNKTADIRVAVSKFQIEVYVIRDETVYVYYSVIEDPKKA